jgi:hypothetical protein
VDVFGSRYRDRSQGITLIRTHGRAHSEIWPATDWKKFKSMLQSMPASLISPARETDPGEASCG